MSARSVGRRSFVRRTAELSAVTAATGVLFLGAMFGAFAVGAPASAQALGRINDILILIAYPLAVPSLLAVGRVVRSDAPLGANLAIVVGLAAVTAIAILQGLLVAEVLTFEQQVGPVSVALLAFGASLLVLGDAARRAGVLPDGRRMGLVGATYVGYPIWAWWVARRLEGSAAAPAAPPTPT